MRVVNYDGVLKGDWADHMEAKIRLESTTPGLQYTRVWKHSKTPYLTQNKTHKYNWGLTSDNRSDRADWRVHVKLIWHRPAPYTNIKKDVYIRSTEAARTPAEAPSPRLPPSHRPTQAEHSPALENSSTRG